MCDIDSVLGRIKKIIKDKKGGIKTQKEISIKIGLEESQLSRKLKTTKGRKEDLTLKEFLKIAKILNIKPALLLNPNDDEDHGNQTNILKEVLRPVVKELIEDLKSK